MTFSQDGRAAASATFKRLSSSTRYERCSLRDLNRVSSRGVVLNPGYNDTSRSNRPMSVPLPSSYSLGDATRGRNRKALDGRHTLPPVIRETKEVELV